jgi:hypothetical protein
MMITSPGVLTGPGIPTDNPHGAGRRNAAGVDVGTGLVSRRRLQIILGCLWLFDGVLQLQPFMFTVGFARQVIAPAGAGQPLGVGGAVRWSASVIAGHPVAYGALFAAVQLALGVGFLVPRTARLAIVGSVMWAFGVWVFGEGLGGIAGGGASVWNGAPGAVALYGLLAVAAWPRSGSREDTAPPRWTARAWVLLWIGFGVLSVLPLNDSAHGLAAPIVANIGTVPGPLASIDRVTVAGIHSLGPLSVPLLVGVLVSVGLISLLRGRAGRLAVWAGCGLAVAVWVVGQSLGDLASGQATDPNAAPLVVLLGLVALTARRPWGPAFPRTEG